MIGAYEFGFATKENDAAAAIFAGMGCVTYFVGASIGQDYKPSIIEETIKNYNLKLENKKEMKKEFEK